MANKKTAGRLKVGLAFILLFGPAFLLIFISMQSCEHKFQKLPDYGTASKYSFTDVNGKKRHSSEFKDDIVLITTLQPGCPKDCSISFINLNLQIYGMMKGKKGLKIISFVTDAEGNPIEDLSVVEAMLKDEVLDYDPKLWILAKGDPRKLYDLRKGNRNLMKELGEDLSYHELMLLLDKSNHLRMVRSGKQEGMVRQLKQHVALLKKEYDLKNYEETHK